MAATYQVVPPEAFNFNRPEEWTKWIRRFERFRKASGLETKDEEAQVNTFTLWGTKRMTFRDLSACQRLISTIQ